MEKRSILITLSIIFITEAREPGFVVLLNGTSSSGKSSISRALTNLLPIPTLAMGVDTIFDMLPPAKKGEWFRPIHEQDAQGLPLTRMKSTPLGKELCRTLAQVVHLFANAGNNVIVDDVLIGEKELFFYVDELADINVYFIGVYCDIYVLEIREAIRGNRPLGIARNQAPCVHQRPRFYDLEVDTARQNPLACAEQIITLIECEKTPHSFDKLRKIRDTAAR